MKEVCFACKNEISATDKGAIRSKKNQACGACVKSMFGFDRAKHVPPLEPICKRPVEANSPETPKAVKAVPDPPQAPAKGKIAEAPKTIETTNNDDPHVLAKQIIDHLLGQLGQEATNLLKFRRICVQLKNESNSIHFHNENQKVSRDDISVHIVLHAQKT